MPDISRFRSELARFFSEDGPGFQPAFPDACEGGLCLWTDGSALGDARQLGTGGGSAFAVTIVAGGVEHYVASYAERLEPQSDSDCGVTVNYAEIKAIHNGLSYLQKLDGAEDKTIHVFSDSAYAVSVLSKWVHRWERPERTLESVAKSGWLCADGWPVANARLIKDTHRLRVEFFRVVYHKIAGHSGYFFNEHADHLASIARNGQLSDALVADYNWQGQRIKSVRFDYATGKVVLEEY